ncbi:related to TIF4631 - mRNA cap-binding protein (eIF4F), 150K subunit [Melanopsichium pennsylvanicum]|uniref:Related to TIF4631 - mRNA cap-binding protein (eIF4F), 150K subunit n=2 Tax=Melanopsichium pennsylvanicum TaxID=63383 RepID=A0AAJ5C4U2_9BASI|nr:related to TIF4631-mRNA cap-binding protein (eIF4F), 150K subunit [Melanopsichium pennsylvanicum 4]SNX84030.1 related to TIF4631 - mRNA cap-binding protein (eIF4F), 150K subunit [Melanopsichium pennsylvanicum]
MSSESNSAGSNNNNVAAAGHNGDANAASNRQSAVSLPKGAANARPAAAINFGSVHDQNAMLSSSPAAQPSSGQHLHGEKPTVFGSVAAHDPHSKKTTIGFAGGKDSTSNSGNAAPAKSMDFQKLFQGSGSPAPSQATASNPSASPSQSSAAPTSAAPSTPQPASQAGARHASSSLRPPSGTPHHPGVRPFEPQRSPSAHQPQASRIAGQQAPPHQQFHAHPQGGPQQPRSPHMANAVPMQPMQPMGGPWPHQQPMAYAPPQYGYHPGYGYQPVPQHWQQPPGFEVPGTPRSPRHANLGSSPMGPNGLPGTPSMAPSTPLSARGANVPPSPSAAHSSVTSPAHQPQGGRPPSFSPAASYAHHSPSHSFSNPMSPAARQFEPQQKRQSAAIRIVNPETQAPVDIQSIQRTPSTSAAKTAAAPTSATASPSISRASPTIVQPAERKPVRMESEAAFLARIHAAQDEAAKKKADQESGKDADHAKKQDVKDKADADAKKKADDEAAAKEAAAQKEAEEKATVERKAAEEAEKRAEAEKKEREEKEKADAEAKAKAEADKKVEEEKKAEEAKKAEEEAKAKTDAAAAAAAEAKSSAEEARPKPAPIDTEKASQHQDGDSKDAAGMRSSVADVERMAREASSVPPSSQDAPKTPVFPQTPRTPGTPGFAGLPAKPLSTLGAAPNGIKLDSEALEKKKKVSTEPTGAAASQHAPASAKAESSSSGASASLTSAKFIDNFSKVSYPNNINSPKSELNESAEPGRFRYDRDFLLQFMNVYTEKPADLPPLASIGMEAGGMGASSRLNRRASAMGPPAAPGRAQGLGISSSSSFGGKGGIGSFSHPPKTSEERFAAASGARGGAMGAFGPMGSFNAGARSQPLSRTGSGSTALPSRDMMGTGVPNGGRTKSNRGRQRDPNSSRGPQVNPPEKGGPTIPLDQVAPLANSENRWSRGASVKADSPEMVQRKVKALLNKLTLEKFDSISNQILEWANKSISEDDGRTLRQVIQLIFEKATDEAAWSEMYARLCRKLMEEVSPEVKDESLRTADDKPVVGGSLFRKYLLNRCQEDFERGWAQRDNAVAAAKSKEAEDRAKKDSNEKAEAEAKAAEERGEKPSEAPKEAELLSDEYYEAQKAKRRGLGLVRFIGELFKLSMLTERIMHLCIKKLLANATDPEEEEIESLCKLMTTVGRLLDTEKARGHMDVYFQRMKEMSKNEVAINSRMRFMLVDVIELREARWVPRHDNSAPKTIAQIHAEAAKQQQQKDIENAARARTGGSISRGGSKRGQARGDGPDGWSTVGGIAPPPRPSKAGDLSHFGKIERGTSGRPLSFGPSTMLGKKNLGKGSEDGSQPPTRTSSQTNMFSLLNQAGEGDAAPAEEPQRPKLNLQPRTKPLPSADKEGGGEGEGEDESKSAEMSDEEAKRKITNDIKEFLEIKDVSEGVEAFNTLPESRRSQFVESIVGSAIEKKKDDVANVAALFAKLSEGGHLDEETAYKGFEPHMEFLDDAAIDIPAIYTFVADLLVAAKMSQEKIEELAGKIVGEGLKSPKDKLLEKVAAARG